MKQADPDRCCTVRDAAGDDVTNDIDHGPLAGWVIVIAHGKTLLGQLVPRDEVLLPVYELSTMMGPAPNGQIMTIRQVLPVLTFASIKSVRIPSGAITIPISELGSKERSELAKNVAACNDLIGAMRANDAGLTIAPAGTKLPPLTVRR